MELIKLTKKEVMAIKKWRFREIKLHYLYELVHFGKIKRLKLKKQRMFSFMHTKLKY